MRGLRTSIYLLAAGAAVLCGCSTIREARKAQSAVAPMGTDAEARTWVAPVVDLRGAPLRALVEFALTNRPVMVSAKLAVEDARLALKEVAADAPLASATPWNALHTSATLGYGESSKSAHFSDLKGRTYRSDPSATLSLDLLIWDFGRNRARAKAQAENVLAAELALVRQGYVVFNEVAKNYFSLLQADALLEVAQTNVAEYAEHVERAETQFEQGVAKQLDVLRAKLDLSNAVEELVSASNDVTVAGANLMAAMGIDAATGTAETVLGPRTNGLDRVLRGFADTDGSARAAFDFACTNAPAMQIVRAKLRASSDQVDAAVADLMPSLTASVSLNWTDPLWYWRWGVNAAQSLFTGGRKTLAVDRAVIAMKSAAADVDKEEQLLSFELERAIAERDNAAEARRTALATLAQAKENLDTVDAQFAVGDASRVDFRDAVADYVKALGNRVRAFYRGQVAEAALFELIGVEPVYAEEWIAGE